MIILERKDTVVNGFGYPSERAARNVFKVTHNEMVGVDAYTIFNTESNQGIYYALYCNDTGIEVSYFVSVTSDNPKCMLEQLYAFGNNKKEAKETYCNLLKDW